MLAIDPAWGRISPRGRADGRFARSYDAAGREYRWYPAAAMRHARFACDVERLRGRAPALLRRRSYAKNARDFCLRWTVAEVLSKLSAIPILTLFRRYRLRHPATGNISTIRLEGSRFAVRTFWIAGRATAVTLGYSLGMRRGAARIANGARS